MPWAQSLYDLTQSISTLLSKPNPPPHTWPNQFQLPFNKIKLNSPTPITFNPIHPSSNRNVVRYIHSRYSPNTHNHYDDLAERAANNLWRFNITDTSDRMASTDDEYTRDQFYSASTFSPPTHPSSRLMDFDRNLWATLLVRESRCVWQVMSVSKFIHYVSCVVQECRSLNGIG